MDCLEVMTTGQAAAPGALEQCSRAELPHTATLPSLGRGWGSSGPRGSSGTQATCTGLPGIQLCEIQRRKKKGDVGLSAPSRLTQDDLSEA